MPGVVGSSAGHSQIYGTYPGTITVFNKVKKSFGKRITKFSETSVGKGEGARKFFELQIGLFQQHDETWIAHYESLNVAGKGRTVIEALTNGWYNYQKLVD